MMMVSSSFDSSLALMGQREFRCVIFVVHFKFLIVGISFLFASIGLIRAQLGDSSLVVSTRLMGV